jgi:hypothetical protein
MSRWLTTPALGIALAELVVWKLLLGGRFDEFVAYVSSFYIVLVYSFSSCFARFSAFSR